MKATKAGSPAANKKAFAALTTACRGLQFKQHDIARQLDQRARYDLAIDKEFPFHITLFQFKSGQYTPTWNWHERLELTIALDGPLRMGMGDTTVEMDAGDLIIVDNLKLHNVQDFPGFKTRVIVMSFMPEFVYAPGSPSCDYAFLLPFYAKREGHPHVLRAEFVQHRQLAERLARLFEFVRVNYAEKISVEQATQLVHMSQAQFMKVFKKVSGMTFVAHVTRVRITQALRLLRETDLTIAEIAAKTGFSDQSYFDRRFRQAFGKSPREWRRKIIKSTTAPA